MKRFVEYRWILEGYTPDTIPMRRLAEYMLEVSKLFGSEERIRFERVENNCVALVNKVPTSISGKVHSRLRLVGRGEGASDAAAANRKLNLMLSEDGGKARVKSDGAIILRFPGIAPDADEPQVLSGPATITGYFCGLTENSAGEIKAKIRVKMRAGRQKLVDATCDAFFANEFKELLFRNVRVAGKANWHRSEAGEWIPKDVHVSKAIEIVQGDIKSAVKELRTINAKWAKNPIALQREDKFDDGDGS